jgi:aerotolerance regulator-like protein/VWA domain-containing protein
MFGLTFLAPAFLLGAAAAAVPIVLHLFKRHVEPEVRFSAVQFLRRAPIEQSRRRRLRELLLLALRVSALVMLALSFARPFFNRASAFTGGPVTIVAVDTSLSMSAPGQFDRARQLARDAVNNAPATHLVGVVAFDDAARVVAAPDVVRGTALAAIDQLHPGFGGTRYGPALTRAAEAVGSAGRIVVVTDLQQVGWESGDRGAVPARVAVEVADVGAPAGNLAVIDLRRDGAGLVAAVRNSGTAAKTSRARLALDGKTLAEHTFTAAPAAVADVRFQQALPAAGVVSVTVDDRDGYEADNARFLVLDVAAPQPVLAITNNGSVTGDAFYLDRALSIGGGATTFKVTVASGESITRDDQVRPYSTVLLLGTKGLDRRGRDALLGFLNAGGGMLITLGPDVQGDVVEAVTGGPGLKVGSGREDHVSFAPVDARHPVFRAFGASVGNLGAIRFTRAGRLAEAGAARVIGRFSDGGPALVEYSVGTGRVLLFGSDLNNHWNDFPLQPAFVPFVHEAVKYLSTLRDSPRDYLVADLPPGAPRRPGAISVAAAAPERGGPDARRRVAVNVDPQESDPSRVTPEAFAAAITRLNSTATAQAKSRNSEQEDRQRLWQYGLSLMLVSLVAEGLLGRRMG